MIAFTQQIAVQNNIFTFLTLFALLSLLVRRIAANIHVAKLPELVTRPSH